MVSEDAERADVSLAVEAASARMRVPSKVEWIEKTVQFLTQKAISCGICSASQSYKIALALHESLTNSVVHGNLEISSELKELDGNRFAQTLASRSADPHYTSRHVEIVFDYDGKRARWTMTDQGPGFDVREVLERVNQPMQIPENEDDLEFLMPSGRGILLMQNTMNEVRYDLGGRKVILTYDASPGAESAEPTTEAEIQEQGEERSPPEDDDPTCVVPLLPDGSIDWITAYDAAARTLQNGGDVAARFANAGNLMIELRGSDRPRYVPAEVENYRTTGAGAFQVSCRLQSETVGAADRVHAETVAEAIDQLHDELVRREVEHHHMRADERLVYTERIEVLLEPPDESFHAYARDLSRSGIAFISTFPVRRQTVEIRVPHPSRPHTLRIVGALQRCEELMAGFYDIGVRFLRWAN